MRGYKLYKIHYDREMYKRQKIAGPAEPKPRSSQLNWNYDVELNAFANRVTNGEGLSRTGLKIAFIDKSHDLKMQEIVKQISGSEADTDNLEADSYNNEKLATEGRNFARAYIHSYLKNQLLKLPDAGIKALTDDLLSEEKLSYVAERLGITELVLCEYFPVPEELTANALLSVISTVYAEMGEEEAENFIRDFIIVNLVSCDIDQIYHITNPMSDLVRLLAERGQGEPEPRLLDQQGADTVMACYTVGIYSDKILIGKSPGESLEIAERLAAQDALLTMYGIQDNRAPMNFNITYRQRQQNNLTQQSRQSISAS